MPERVLLKRVYDDPSPDDGYRVLVDRLWPRGLTKERAALDLWLKDVAPTTELRKEWHHDPARFEEFAESYRAELATNPALGQLREVVAAHERITFVSAVPELANSHVPVLRDEVIKGG